MKSEQSSKALEVYRQTINLQRNGVEAAKASLSLLKGAKYAFYVFLLMTALIGAWYFISGEFLNPLKVVGTGAYAQSPAWNTYAGVIVFSVATVICWVTWKVILPRQQNNVEKLQKEADEACAIIEKAFFEKDDPNE